MSVLQAANDRHTAFRAALLNGPLAVIKLFMEGPFRNVAALENICPPMVQLQPHVAEFVKALHHLHAKTDFLLCVLSQCEILPCGALYCLDECTGCGN